MRLQRALGILGLALAVQLGGFAAIRWSSEQARAARPLVPGLREAPIDRIVLGGARANDPVLTLQKNAEVWGLEEFDDYPADARSIEALLRTLLVIEAEGPIVTKAQHHASLKLQKGDAQGRLRLFARGSEKPVADLTFGSSSPTGAAYVRSSDDDDVFEVLGLASWDVRSNPAPWIEQPYLELPLERTAAIHFARANESFGVRRANNGWVVESGGRSRDADSAIVAETLKLLGTLAPLSPAGKTGGVLPGTSTPIVSVRLEFLGGATASFAFGTGSADSRITVASPERAHAAEVWKSSVEPILTLTAAKAGGA